MGESDCGMQKLAATGISGKASCFVFTSAASARSWECMFIQSVIGGKCAAFIKYHLEFYPN